MSKLRKAARDRHCTVRVPGHCNGNPETTVLAHYRMAGQNGTGIKPSDFLGAWACSNCHDAIDFRVLTEWSREELRMFHLEGVMRTLAQLEKEGLIGVRK